jgi:hypothetical protein
VALPFTRFWDTETLNWPILRIFVIPAGFCLLLGIVGIILYVRYLPRLVKRREARADAIRKRLMCLCGYDLSGLDVARCPECGRVVGFDATPELLGLTPEELARIQQPNRARGEAQQ